MSQDTTTALLTATLSITRLLNTIAYAEDTLDWSLFTSSWTDTQPLQIDLSTHLPNTYTSDQTFSPASIAQAAHTQLSGFDGTQHTLTNFVVDVEETGLRASARAYVTAYHALARPVGQGPGFVLVRGLWHVSCTKQVDGAWKATGIKVERLVGAEGDEELYDLARARGESGLGRTAKSLWD